MFSYIFLLITFCLTYFFLENKFILIWNYVCVCLLSGRREHRIFTKYFFLYTILIAKSMFFFCIIFIKFVCFFFVVACHQKITHLSCCIFFRLKKKMECYEKNLGFIASSLSIELLITAVRFIRFIINN